MRNTSVQILLLCILIAGCSDQSQNQRESTPSVVREVREKKFPVSVTCTNPLPAQVLHKSIVTNTPSDFDPAANPSTTTKVFFNVLLPERCPNQRFAVVMHSHGYGGQKLADIETEALYDSNSSHTYLIEALTKNLPSQGYVVISMDQRGHGESKPENGGGRARMIDPNAETKDASAVLDWAYENAEALAIFTEEIKNTGIEKDILIATIGLSYGGGYQMPLAALDSRIDAIIPNATWYSLQHSIAPGHAAKLFFTGALCTLGASTANTAIVQAICNEVGIQAPQAFTTRSYPVLVDRLTGFSLIPRPRIFQEKELTDFFQKRGMVFFRKQQQKNSPWGFGEKIAKLRNVPALFIQGNRDVLFNLTDAYWNWRYFSEAGNDVHLLSTEGGHMNPLAGQIEGSANCGPITGADTILVWLEKNLKGITSEDYKSIPKVCISVANTVNAHTAPSKSVSLDHFPVGQLTGNGSYLANRKLLSATLTPLQIGPIFLKIANIQESGLVIAGAPKIASVKVKKRLFQIQTVNAFIGTAIRRKGQIILIDDQVTGFNEGLHDTNLGVEEDPYVLLPAVGEMLEPGDEVGLAIYPEHPQFAALASAQTVGSALTTGLDFITFNMLKPITSALSPVLGLLYNNALDVELEGVELPIFSPGTYPSSQLN